MARSEDQYILDSLLSLPNTVIETSIALVDALERNIDEFALHVRENLSSSTWLPPPVRPSPPPQRIPAPSFSPLSPEGLLAWARHAATENAALVAAVVAFAGTGGFVLWRRHRAMRRKRRARRALNGARKDAVIVTGTIHGPIALAVLQDLERRGFVVYFAVSNGEEEAYVNRLANPNITALRLDISDATITEAAVSQFLQNLKRAHTSASLHLAGLLVIPSATAAAAASSSSSASPSLPSDPVESTEQQAQSTTLIEQLQPVLVSDALNTNVLYPITIIRALLGPLKSHNSRIVLLTPGIAPSLATSQSLTATISGALDGFSAALATELRSSDVPVIQMKLGKFQVGRDEIDLQRQLVLYGADTASIPLSKRSVSRNGSGGVEGTPLRELHEAIFDALMLPNNHSGVWRVGRGSWIYSMVERLAPWGSMRWRLGLRAAQTLRSSMPLRNA